MFEIIVSKKIPGHFRIYPESLIIRSRLTFREFCRLLWRNFICPYECKRSL